MIRLDMIWGIARAELRLARRLVRYWIFIVLATLWTAVQYGQTFFIHYFFSGYSASAAGINPRYFMGGFGWWFVMVFMIGAVFLAFDVRARDSRDRIVEVVDALPCTNIELVFGRFLGLLIASWVPVVVVTLLLLLTSALLKNPMEPLSIVGFIFLMTLPACLFVIGLVFFLTLLLRHRLAAALASLLVIVGASFVSLWFVPLHSIAAVDLAGRFALPVLPSDISPGMIDFPGLVQRLGWALAGLAFLFFSAVIHPRRDDGSAAKRVGAGVLALVLAATCLGSLVYRGHDEIATREGWREAHEARQDEVVPDLLAIEGDVLVDPGQALDLDLRLRFRAPQERSLDRALFTLNPGMEIRGVTSATGAELEFVHENGLLDVALASTLAPGEETEIALAAAGEPDARFAYLDAYLEPMSLTAADGQVIVLGYETIIMDDGFFALLPGVRWLPSSGPDVGVGEQGGRPLDFYKVDLTVDVPEGWLVAGPGKRREPDEPAGAERARFRFAPEGFTPDVALVGGHYESRAIDVDGVEMEILVHPGHTKNLETFADAGEEIRDWLAERLQEAKDVGLDYPYDALTLVEVPNALRGYGGGWRMDTTLIQPAMILMRESSFTTARFERRESAFEQGAEEEGGVPRAKREVLENFFQNDMSGGNPFVAAARSFFGYQTAGEGPEAIPLDFVWESLSSKVLADKQGYFSVHFFDQQFGQTFAAAAQEFNNADRVGNTYAEIFVHLLTSRPEVWDTVLGVSLAGLDPREDPKRTLNALTLKGGAMARSMLDDLGREKTGQLLAALRTRTAGRSYTREDVVAAGQDVGEDLEGWLALWIDQTDLPGFTLGNVSYERISDSEEGLPRYQAIVTINNEESPSGLVRLEYVTEEDNSRNQGEPVVVPGGRAVEIGLVTSTPLRTLRVAPYFALNRDPFAVPLPEVDQEKIVEADPFTESREVDWTAPVKVAIVVDDLDEGFDVSKDEGSGSRFRFAGRGLGDVAMDQGLPVSDNRLRPTRWSRYGASYAHGKYRRTMAVVRAGDGTRHAVFTAELPETGQWKLEYYLPRPSSGSTRRRPGTWNLLLDDGSESRDIVFDADGGESGWNEVGTYDLPAGEVQVKISDETDGDYVVADAIRWTPVSRATDQVASR